jgi:hypothetical protein
VRPRPRRTGTPPPPANGTHPKVEIPEPLRDLTHALEDLHGAAKALRLAPLRVEWQEDNEEPDEQRDPERLALQRYVETMLDDYEGVRAGPIAVPVSQVPPPGDPHAFLVGNLIRPGTTVMLAGPPGAAKSWASRQLALACGGGRQMYLEHYPIEKPLNVLVVDEDNGPDEEWRRDETLLQFLELRRDQVGSVRRVSLEGVQLDQERWQRWLRGQVRLHDIDLVILDPISEMHGGKELREDPAFRSMLAFLKRLKVDFPRLATVIVHHTRKRDPKAAVGTATLEDVRGQWGQTPDVVAMLIPMGDRRSKWEVHKRVPHSSLILEQVAEGQPGEGALRKVADAEAMVDKRSETDGKVLAAIDAGAATVEEIVLGTQLSKSGVYKALARLNSAGLITKRAPFARLDDPSDQADGGLE